MEGCPSGLRRRSWKPLNSCRVPWVRIPPSPYQQKPLAEMSVAFFCIPKAALTLWNYHLNCNCRTMLSHDMITISFSEYFLYSTTHRFHHCIRHCFFCKIFLAKKAAVPYRRHHILHLFHDICQPISHLWPDVLFSAKISLLMQLSVLAAELGAWFFGFLCMGIFFRLFYINRLRKKSNCPNRCGMRSGLQYPFVSYFAPGIMSSSE